MSAANAARLSAQLRQTRAALAQATAALQAAKLYGVGR